MQNHFAEALSHLKLASDLMDKNDPDKALIECEEAVRLAPDWADAHYLKGALLQLLGHSDKASESFQTAKSYDLTSHARIPGGTVSKKLDKNQIVPWNNRDAWWGLAIDLVFYFPIPLALLLLFEALSIDIDAILVIMVFLGPMTTLIPVWWFTRRKYGAGLATLGFRRFTGSSLGIGCGLLIAGYIGMIAYGVIITMIGWEMDSNLESDSGDLSIPTWVLPLVAIAIAPVVEEVFFRGFLFAGLRQRYGWVAAALVSAGVFSLLHLMPIAIPPLFILGFLLAYVYQRSNSIWIPIFLHAIYNSWVVIVTFVIDVETEEGLIDLLISL